MERFEVETLPGLPPVVVEATEERGRRNAENVPHQVTFEGRLVGGPFFRRSAASRFASGFAAGLIAGASR